MRREVRTIVYDDELKIEAYRLAGIVQPFPNHFHEYYVLGFVENGQRVLSCKNKEYGIDKGSIILFNPGDNHGCIQSDGGVFDYRGFNITVSVMLDLAEEVTGRRELPFFTQNVLEDAELGCYLRLLHELVMRGSAGFGKEENLLLLISALLQKYGQPCACRMTEECSQEIEKACEFIRLHFKERIYLDQICSYAGLSKSTLLRGFTRLKGVTPYRYLETLRVSEAKKLLQQGVQPAEAAMQTGFSDQSHFTNYFNSFIGLTPGVYRAMFTAKNKNGE